MTTIYDHQSYVEKHPFDTVAALALADRLQDDSNRTRWDALRFVASLRRPGRDAHYLALASAIMRRKSSCVDLVNMLIQSTARLHGYRRGFFVVVRGHQRPTVREDRLNFRPSLELEICIWVGVRWIIAAHRHFLKQSRRRKPVSAPRSTHPTRANP